jgi:hypothetical protein
LDSQELKAGSGQIQEPSNCRSWPIGLSRIEGLLRIHSRAFILEELANGTLMNGRPALDTFKSLKRAGAGQLDPQELKACSEHIQ